jgi:RimJ/RimL family protein N-acetyltransferase
MNEVPELRTERLLMRGWRDEDFEAWTRILADPLVAQGIGHPTGMTPGEAWRHMAAMAGHWELKGFGNWVLEDLSTGEVVGRAGPYEPAGWPGLEIGWTVGRDHWGKGYAPEAAREAARWVHDVLGADHFISVIDPANARSIRVAEKLGEKLEGEFSYAGFDLLVYGADLPLGGSPRWRAGTPAP